MEELIHSHIKKFTRKQKGDKKMKHRKREPGSGVSSTKSNISRAMRGRVPKVPIFLAMRNQQPTAVTTSHSKHHASSSSTTPAAAAQNTRTSDRTRRSPSYYGFESSSPNSTILPPPKQPRRAGDVENFQRPPESIVESVQHIAENQPEEQNISPLICQVSPPAPRNPPLIDIDTPTLAQSMTALEAEKQHLDNDEWDM